MKPGLIFQQYVWLINAFRRRGRLTLSELNDMWVREEVTGGNPLPRATFNRHRDAVLDMFGVVIECDAKDGYRYYIYNPDVLEDTSLERWMLSTLTVGGVLSDSMSLKDRIILEDVPAGEEHLPTIIRAIRGSRRVAMTYQRFGADSYEKTVSPLALKLFHQRWYLLAFTGRHYATYSLDRMLAVAVTDEDAETPSDFAPQDYFSDYFGVLTDGTPMAHVVIRAYGTTADYIRTLPLHWSQQETAGGDGYADFTYDIRTTADFLDHLLSFAAGVEILKPQTLRRRFADIVRSVLSRYDRQPSAADVTVRR